MHLLALFTVYLKGMPGYMQVRNKQFFSGLDLEDGYGKRYLETLHVLFAVEFTEWN